MTRDDDRPTDPDRTKVAIADPLVGSILGGRYRIEVPLAAGGFGAIYHATDLTEGRDVALKVLHGKLAADPGVTARFRREAEALANLRDPHTITAYEFGEALDGTLFIAMELLEGQSLHEKFRETGPLPWRRVVTIARAVCGSLAEAHALGIVHRDLKPANIHLERRGDDRDFVKVLDFGIAKILQTSTLDSSDLTNAGQMIGTFDYMAPEQMVGGTCTGQSDIFTLGVVMYEMICGQRPFGDPQTTAAMLAALFSTTPAPLSSRSDAPVELDRIVARCLERDPDDRFADVGELAAALETLAIDDDRAKTKEIPAQSDDKTWIDQAPQPVNPKTTLPGIVPPSPRSSWPLNDPTKRRR